MTDRFLVYKYDTETTKPSDIPGIMDYLKSKFGDDAKVVIMPTTNSLSVMSLKSLKDVYTRLGEFIAAEENK